MITHKITIVRLNQSLTRRCVSIFRKIIFMIVWTGKQVTTDKESGGFKTAVLKLVLCHFLSCPELMPSLA